MGSFVSLLPALHIVVAIDEYAPPVHGFGELLMAA